ncbi:MAG: hypothetical protein ACI9MC_002203 [Kiritimatiellia bacterium]|jgi:hypothetical protein
MRVALTVLALLVTTNAVAGGVGLLATGGLYNERVYFYDKSDNYRQYQQTQTIGTMGTGLELTLGDRDDRVNGIARAYWQLETPQSDPANLTGLVDPGNVVAAYREEARHIGIFTVGMQIMLLGSPDKFSLNLVGTAGSGFLTEDHTEFLMLELGTGANYRIARNLELNVTAQAHLRYRKWTRMGVTSYAGMRVLFD